ncbi:MAG: RagB/SusD family nutrient uptake outer membrane protein [Lachnospiraceae bacterium]
MKKILILVSLVCLLTTGCNDSAFLREKPEDFLTVDNAFLNVNQFKTGINQMYAQVRALYNSNDGSADWILMGAGTDVFMIPRGDGTDYAYNDWKRVYPTDGISSRYWNDFYGIIKNCNELLKQTENANVQWYKEGQKEEIQAEICFFRAYAYRGLANLFGGVPILLEPIVSPKLDFVRSTRVETYQQAINDAEFASKYLPTTLKTDGQIVRATADHLLTELYIALSDNGGAKSYDKAIRAATRVLDGTDGDYELMTSRFGSRVNEKEKNVYWDLFRMGNQNYLEAGNTECLWAVQFKENTPGGTNAFDRPLIERTFWPSFWQNKKFGYDGVARDWTGRGVAWMRPTNYVIYEIWKNAGNDIRNLEVNINRRFHAPFHLKDGVEDPTDMTPYETIISLPDGTEVTIHLKPGDEIRKEWLTTRADTMERYFPRFFKFGTDKHIDKRPDNGYVPDYYVFRVAETYLLRAEAYLKNGNADAAVLDVNKIRARSKAPLINVSQMSLDYILDERARELLGEEYRFMTLSRMNKLYDRVKKHGWEYAAFSVQEHNNLLPIPQSAIDANLEAILEQNPGY